MIDVKRWDGVPVRMPGWYDRVPLSVYHSNRITAQPSVSSSGLRFLWGKSPRHFFAKWAFNPAAEHEDDETKAFTIGRAAHHLFLGEDNFSLEYIQRPEKIAGLAWQGNRTECRAFIKAQAAAGRTVLKPEDIKTIKGMAASLSQDRMAMDLLQGQVEQTLIAPDEDTGIWLRARPDVIPTADGIFADLKTTESVVDVDLKRTLRNYGYHMQGALIWQVCEELGLPFDGFVLIFIEKSPPYCTRVVELTDEDLGRGRLQNIAMTRLIKRCMDEGNWPGPGKADAESFSIPKTEQEFIDARLAQLEA